MITTIQQKRSYPWLYSFTCWLTLGFLLVFGSLFPLFCNALHMSKTQIGVILSILPFSYLITIFVSQWVARHGPKKIMLIFYFIRYWFILLMPLAIWIARQYGSTAAFAWIAFLVLFFAVFRSIGETGWAPWMLDLIPSRVRGKVDALNSIAGNIGAAIASLAAVLIMKLWPGFTGYSTAIYIGVLFGFFGIYMVWRLPGGEPQSVEKKKWDLIANFRTAIQNARFTTWLKGMSLFSIGGTAFVFLPLFLSEKIGFTVDKIMLFSVCFQAGVLLSAVFWGWSADRFGSKPVVMTTCMALCLIPVFFVILPRMDQQSMIATGGVYALLGVLSQGALAGLNRYFFVTVLPTVQNPIFCSSVNLAIQSVVAAVCAFLFGWLLDMMQSVKYDWRILHIDNFTILFVLMLVCYIGFLFVFRRAAYDTSVRTGQFVSFFLEGNPLLAFSSIVRFNLSGDEGRRMELTRMMGDAKSHLTVEELLHAADDPSFNVRYEAIVSMARMPPDNKLINALALAVRSREPGVSEAACWAMGRMGDERAVPVLREMLKCEYALLRSQSARALAKLNDQASIPQIIEAFKSEKNDNICAGYAAALGRFKKKDALPLILALLRRLSDEHLRGEAALSAARIMGGEHHFVNLWRRSRSDFETICAEELMTIRKKIAPPLAHAEEYRQNITKAIKCFEQRNLAEAVAALSYMLKRLLPAGADLPSGAVLNECDEMLAKHGGTRGDYILLALCGFHIAIAHVIKNKLYSQPSGGYACRD